jgi:thiol-disulfide isomerase/thioredoxin
MRHAILLALLLVASRTASAAVEVGAKMPPLGAITWMKGEAVAPGKGRMVVEFWATWCAPCRESIPHLTKLQQAHPTIAIVGLSSEEADTVKPFIAEKGDTMAYHVGICPDETWNAFMDGVSGPPHAYIVDADGTVLWEGHPMSLDQPLDELEAGRFDPAKAKQVATLDRQVSALVTGMTEANHEASMRRILALTDQALALEPFDDGAIQPRLDAARHLGDHAAFRDTYARMPIEHMNVERANGYAWKLATSATLPDRNLDLAFAFAKRAVGLAPNDDSCAETLALVYYDLGLIEEAIAEQARAAALDPKNADYQTTLEFYRSLTAIRDRARVRQTPPVTPAK